MAFSDDEAEAEINSVSNYDFVDDNDEPISFSELSVQWKEGERLDGRKKHIFLRGDADNGNMKVYEEVTAWKFDLSSIKPDIWVLHKKNSWILLLKPRKAFEDTIIRTILVSLHCLHFFRKNPDSSVKAFWDHMHKVFSFEPRPSENDLVDHMDLISEVVKHDDILAKSKVLDTLLKERPKRRIILDEVNDKTLSGFIVDDLGDETFEDVSDDDEDDQFESVCAICDNGGEIICCEGKCLRSFHATKEAGRESYCESLGYTREQVDAIQKFYCKNCEYQKHQCYACGELGSSDLSSGAEVFRCINATCGRFYHPHCVAKLLHREKQLNVDNLQKKIAAGEPFACPMHQCFVCNQIEDKNIKELQFAICRRCPRSYHRKCLPSGIAFEDKEDQDIVQRAWDDLIPNRILIYCLEHEIDEELMTPTREHLKFPGINRQKIKKKPEVLEKKKIVREDSSPVSQTGAANQKHIVSKQSKGLEKLSTGVVGVSSKKREGRLPPPNFSKKQKVMDTPRKSLEKKASFAKQDRPTAAEGKVSLGQKLFELNQLMCNDAEPIESNEVAKDSSAKKETGSSLLLDADSKKRILGIVKDASSITLKSILKKHKVPTENAYSSKFALDKSMTLGKVEGSIKAIRTALQRLEEGGSVDDAKVVCDPAHLTQIMKWKNKLKVYLAPFLYGLRYTSFGRHFTQVDKLKEIVNMLHWYVGDGDTIVDFCCGSNDFSCLMKKKLDEMGRNCSFKNFDILQAKNDFCFEKRDWMTVQSKELPPGSKLIMGLNPPFGVNAALANKFINKALEFKPKLLILIVPRETKRLDDKKNPYDLIWENDELLGGKAFYLPGSVDINDKTLEDWNVSTPPLYLWSRPDWTPKHKEIAEQRGHLSRAHGKQDENRCQKPVSGDDLASHDCQVESSRMEDHCFPDNKPELAQSQTDITGCLEERSRCNSSAVEVQNDHDSGVKQSDENSKQQGIHCSKEKRESTDITVENKSTGKRSLPRQPSPGRPRDRKWKGKSTGKRSLPRDLSPGKASGRSIQAEDKSYGKTSASRDTSPGKASSKQLEAEDKYTGKRKRHSSSPLKGHIRPSPTSMTRERPSHTEAGREDYQQASSQRLEAEYKTTGKKSKPQAYSPNKGRDRSIPPSKRHEMPSQTEAGWDNYRHFTGNSGSGSQGQIPIAFGAHHDDDVVRKYLPGSNLSNRWPHIASPGAAEYGIRASDEHFMGRESTDVSHYGFNRMEEYGRQSDIHRQIQLYGQHQGQDYLRQRSPNMVGPNQGFPLYGQHPIDNDPTYGGMPMRWHPPPQLHDPGFDPHLTGRSELYGSINPRPPSHHVNSLGFAQGPYRPFSQNNSGWLND